MDIELTPEREPYLDYVKDEEGGYGDYVLDYKVKRKCKRLPWRFRGHGKYCIYQVEGSESKDVIYFFHGVFGFEWFWGIRGKYKAMVQNMLLITKDIPTVVSISFGRAHILTPKNFKRRSGHLEVTAEKAIPYIEKKFKLNVNKRFIMGDSMGGYNVAELYLNYPHLFNKAAIFCPPITILTPYCSRSELKAYMDRTGALLPLALLTKIIGRVFFPTLELWHENSVLDFAKKNLDSSFPKIYISAATNDQFGFSEGTIIFKDLALERGVDVEFHYITGNHCETDPASIANFLIGD